MRTPSVPRGVRAAPLALLVVLASGAPAWAAKKTPPPAKPAAAAAPAAPEKPAEPVPAAAEKPAETPADAAAGKPAETPVAAPVAEKAPEKPAEPVEEPAVKRAPRNRSLEYAKDLVKQGRGDEALKELETAASLKGNTAEVSLEIAATRVQAILLQKKPAEFAARELAIEVLHQDPDGLLFKDAAEPTQALLADIRAEQVFVLHDRLALTKPGRPVKLKARVTDPRGQVATVTLHYRGHAVGGWSAEAMRKDAQGFSGFIRDPSVLAPGGVTDDYGVDYFLTAEDAAGKLLDQNGSEELPLAMLVSSTKTEEPSAVDLAAFDLHDGPREIVAPPTPAKPWYLEWYTLTGAGVVVVGATVAIVYAATREKPLEQHIGILNLP